MAIVFRRRKGRREVTLFIHKFSFPFFCIISSIVKINFCQQQQRRTSTSVVQNVQHFFVSICSSLFVPLLLHPTHHNLNEAALFSYVVVEFFRVLLTQRRAYKHTQVSWYPMNEVFFVSKWPRSVSQDTENNSFLISFNYTISSLLNNWFS